MLRLATVEIEASDEESNIELMATNGEDMLGRSALNELKADPTVFGVIGRE